MKDVVLAWQFVRRRPWRTTLFLVQLTVCFSVCAIACSYLFQAWAQARLPYRVFGENALGLYLQAEQHRRPTPVPIVASDLTELEGLPGVRSVAVIHRVPGTASDLPLTVVAVNDAFLALGDGSPLRLLPGQSAGAVTRRLAIRLGVRAGDRLPVRLYDGRVLDLVLTEPTPARPLPPPFPSPRSVGQLTSDDNVVFVRLDEMPGIFDLTGGLWITVEPGRCQDAGDAISRWWRDRHPGSGLYLQWFSVAEACQDMVRESRVVLWSLVPFGLLLLLLAGAGFVGTSMLSVDSRRTELAVRRALGATPGQIARQLAAECLCSVLPAAVVSTVVGTAVTLAASPVTPAAGGGVVGRAVPGSGSAVRGCRHGLSPAPGGA